MKSFLFAILITFSFMSADSSSETSELSEERECECTQDETPDSFCRGVANLAVYDLFEREPNTTHEDAWNYEVAVYSACIIIESLIQVNNNEN